MFKDFPQVIQMTIWKHLLLSLLIAGFGAVWSIAANDRIFILLTVLIVLLSAMRLLDFLRMVRRKITVKWRELSSPTRRSHCAAAMC